jgi:hypothetical protein
VSDVDLGEQDLSFHVDKVGVPVLVKVSYFPNWKVEGAEGSYRIAPNLMVVVPTSNDVHMTYGRSTLDLAAYGMTFAGLCLLVLWRIRGDVRHAGNSPLRGDDPLDDPFGAPFDSAFDDELLLPPPVLERRAVDQRQAGEWNDADLVWADDRSGGPAGDTAGDATAVLQRDELDLTVPAERPSGLPDGERTHPDEVGDDPAPPVDRL